MSDRALMALFDVGHQLDLPNGYWLRKTDDNLWQIGGPLGSTPDCYLAMHVAGNLPVGPGGSMDAEIRDLAAALCEPERPLLKMNPLTGEVTRV